MKRWNVLADDPIDEKSSIQDILTVVLKNRGVTSEDSRNLFLSPPHPENILLADVAIDALEMSKAVTRIWHAISKHESIIVYADYDADGVTAGSIMWEAIFALGGSVMPYIPHRVDEGYGLSEKGIDAVIEKYHPTLIVTVDHGITCHDEVEYAKKHGIDVVVTDHHVKPDTVPDAVTVHTTQLCGAGIAWFVGRELFSYASVQDGFDTTTISGNAELLGDLLALASIGTVADMVPLVGANRSIAKYGLEKLRKTPRPGIVALVRNAGLTQSELSSIDISHVMAPRINAMGRLEHALDSLRLMCTRSMERAEELANLLGSTNKDRQQLTIDATTHALAIVEKEGYGKVIIVSHDSYNQGIIGLVAGKLVERYYRPSIVLSISGDLAKASARSIRGFNIIEALRANTDLLLDVGGHPMAAGFTMETTKIDALCERLNARAETELTEELMTPTVTVDATLPAGCISEGLWKAIRTMEPFGLGNYEPVFITTSAEVVDFRLVGQTGKHLKLKVRCDRFVASNTSDSDKTKSKKMSAGKKKTAIVVSDEANEIDKKELVHVPMQPIVFDAIGFGMGEMHGKLHPGDNIDIAYTIDMNEWNNTRSIQLKLRDIHLH
jgi:single-stranded-DNA-specific exonuclease